MSPAGFVQPRRFIQARTLPGSIVITDCGLRSYDPFLFPSVVLPWKSRRFPRPKVSFPYSNCGAVSDFVYQLKGVVGSIPCWLFLGSCEEHDGEKVTGLVACTQTFSVLICSEMFRRTALATSSMGARHGDCDVDSQGDMWCIVDDGGFRWLCLDGISWGM